MELEPISKVTAEDGAWDSPVKPVQFHTHNGIDSPELDITSVGGSNTEIQYNNNGELDGIPTATYDNVQKVLTLSAETKTTGDGGAVEIIGGEGTGTGSGGDVEITAGSADGASGYGGNIFLYAGAGSDNASDGGDIVLIAGGTASGGTGDAGNVEILAGVNDASSVDANEHGAVVLGEQNSQIVYNYYINKYINSSGTLTVFSFPIPPSNQADQLNPHQFVARIIGVNNVGNASSYIVTATYARNDTAAPQLIGSIQNTYTAENDAGWDATFSISSNNINLDITVTSGPLICKGEVSIVKF